ncbi:M1 family metallopeptidase [Salegentibacter sp. F188]|uniref:Aminopeptidase N n=1 Tax=Autumnicola patrickiae TaxID=3075591 RepID=A0ABU3DXT1_9FLAO|nr:M1 family metallopeptidase [Salegentibacter sp. F188]MDT0688515.1 M1 family metallopeptidase [Salegentibacter sp. F188]
MKKIFQGLFFLISITGIAQNSEFLDQIQDVDFKNVNATVTILPEEEKVAGEVEYLFEILQFTDSIFIDAHNMDFEEVMLNGNKAEFSNDNRRLWIKGNFRPSEGNKLTLKYSATPKQTMYFINWAAPKAVNAPRQVWTQGQGKYTSHWLPSFDDMQEKAIFDLQFRFRPGYEVIANGVLQEREVLNDSVVQWSFDMEQPMSSYLVAVAAGNYRKEEKISASGVEMLLYYEPEDSLKVEPTYRYSKEIFDFLEQEIGVDYPWQNYKQVPVQDFLYAGMENTGTTIFSNVFVVDSIGFNDRNYVNVNAHELAHQWFGNLVTETGSKDHWLHEGFATFYALLAEKEIFGEDYYYWKLYESAEQLKDMSDAGKGESVLNPKASSLTFYQKGAWALHILRERVGEEAFNEAVRNYLNQYKFSTVTTDNFIAEVEKTSGQDLSDFIENWLKQSAFKATDALNSLKKSQFITDYLAIAGLREVPLPQKFTNLNAALNFPVNDYIGQEVVFQLAGNTSEEAKMLYEKAFETNNLYVRQAIAMSMDQIPAELKTEYESLLEDDSYLTKETALYNLWMQFPKNRNTYLQRTEGVTGFMDKNVEILWLALNLATPNFQAEKNQEIFEQLSDYTSPYYHFGTRQNAFGYLYQLNAFTDKNLKDLLQGTQHHTSSFRNYCKKLLEELLKQEEYRKKFQSLADEVPEKQREFLQTNLNN